ncbi:MAG: phosphonate metabolism protein PhnP [Pseudomonadota bacterium]|jgi:phosphoribosyl 1,2-cyclic phosphate phosphodiesterase
MRLSVLGSGDASGIPRADCADPACACARARAGTGPARRNTCALVEGDGTTIAIDTGCGAQACTGLLLTHYHPDHAGHRADFPSRAWGPDDGLEIDAAGTPGIDIFPKPARVKTVPPFATISVGTLRCTALPLNHPIPVHGWAIEGGGRRIAWLTDTYGIPAPSLAWLAANPCDLVALDTTFAPGVERAPLKGHGDLAASLAAIAACGARRALLIHIGHGHQTWLDANPGRLPAHIAVAHDGEAHDV